MNRLQAQGHCDPSLTLITENALAYRDRGDRCEGIYIKQVSSTPLLVASFNEHFDEYDVNSGKALKIEWDRPPNNKAIHVRTQSIKYGLHYRMDTYRPSGQTAYMWPSDILASMKILKKDIGVVGITQLLIGQKQRDVYLPLRISKEGKVPRTGKYTLLLLPGVELSEIYITVASVGTDGRPAKFFSKGKELGYGYYPAERSVEIPISAPKDTRICYLEIGAKKKSGGTQTIECWFYNPK
ncbi:MAG: hypothetical protein WKF97_09605 [Chitinophagaceae bacterium]